MRRASYPWRTIVAAHAFVFLVAGVLSMTVLMHAQQASAQTQAGSQEQSVVVRGNRRIETATILSYMDLKPGQTVTAEDLNRAVRRLFDTGLFRDVQIIPADQQLVVEVVENPSINQIAFEGNEALADEDLERAIALRSRLPFTISAAEADAQAIIEIYRRTGRYGAEVEVLGPDFLREAVAAESRKAADQAMGPVRQERCSITALSRRAATTHASSCAPTAH